MGRIMRDGATYFRHVDGLRAIAVFSVIIYHISSDLLPGGYVGVDVFFVISGFLITNLIYKEIAETGGFDFRNFYIRRIRRLLPALIATVTASLFVAGVVMTPDQFKQFGFSVSAAILSVSNIFFWSESGYFDSDAIMKPLLHTWSLSVEEQFYLLWPAALLFIVKRSSWVKPQTFIAAIVCASLALNVLWVHGGFDEKSTSTIFYWTPFRIFELGLGAMLVFINRVSIGRLQSEVLMIFGLSMIAFSVLSFDELTVFPYYYALLPCMGAVFVIMSGGAKTIGSFLTNPISVGVGLISYSMYLVHWPLLSFAGYMGYEFPPEYAVPVYLVLTVVIAVLVYFLVEKKFRIKGGGNQHKSPQRPFFVSSAIVSLLLVVVGGQIYGSDGWSWRKQATLTATLVEEGMGRRFSLVRQACTLVNLDDPGRCDLAKDLQVLVIGNSHEPDGYNAFHQLFGGHPNVNLIVFGTFNRCGIFMEGGEPFAKEDFRACEKRTEKLRDRNILSNIDIIVYSANKPFAGNKEIDWAILESLRLKNPAMSLVVLGGFFNTTRPCSEIINKTGRSGACGEQEYLAFNPIGERDGATVSDLFNDDYFYLDKLSLVCATGDKGCLMEGNGEPAFYDQHHLSLGYAQLLGRRMWAEYENELTALGFPGPTFTASVN